MKKYITSKSRLKDFLKYEAKLYGIKKAHYPLIAISENKVLYRYNYILRKREYYTNCNKTIRKYISRLISIRMEREHSIFLAINVFDKGLKLVHIGPRLVNGGATVGKNFTMHANTYIVAGGVNDIAPRIGDNCIMGVGSIILGKAELGNNIAIGAGSVVNKQFPEGKKYDNCSVTG